MCETWVTCVTHTVHNINKKSLGSDKSVISFFSLGLYIFSTLYQISSENVSSPHSQKLLIFSLPFFRHQASPKWTKRLWIISKPLTALNTLFSPGFCSSSLRYDNTFCLFLYIISIYCLILKILSSRHCFLFWVSVFLYYDHFNINFQGIFPLRKLLHYNLCHRKRFVS